MKRLVLILAISVAQAFAAASIVQSNIGGSGTATLVSGGTVTTSSVGFGSNTTSGSTLIMVYWIRQEAITGAIGGIDPRNIVFTTPGFTWINTAVGGGGAWGGFLDLNTETHYGIVGFAYISNAAAMATSVHTSLSVNDLNPDHATTTMEFLLYEVSGLSTFARLQGPTSNETGTPSTPGQNVSPTPGSKFVIIAMDGFPGSNLTATGGWTLGPNATVSTIGQSAYQLLLSGSSSSQFTGTLSLWGVIDIQFNLASSGGVPRHRGAIF